MDRFARASRAELEQMLLDAERDGLHVENALYPPSCRPASGTLGIRRLGPGFMLTVEPRAIATDDFRLHVLFHGGECPFGNAGDLTRFLRGPVAAAFGLEADAGERDEQVVPEEGELDVERVAPAPAAPARRRAQAKARTKPGAARPARAPMCEDLERRLGDVVHGQEAAVHRIADVVSAHLAKVAPARPESLVLIGPTGSGKTSVVEALPDALADLRCPGAHVFRIDCNELASEYDVHRFLGPAPGLVGYTARPPLFEALAEPRCIVLLDELEKAHDEVHTVFLGLLDEGRLTAPNGEAVRAPDAVVAITTNAGSDDLAHELRHTPPHERMRRQVCRDHFLRLGWAPELVGRIGAFAAFEPLGRDAVRLVAEDAIAALGREYGLDVAPPPPVIVDALLDIADAGEIGARAVGYAARELLGQPFAAAARAGLTGEASLDPGPPPTVRAAAGVVG